VGTKKANALTCGIDPSRRSFLPSWNDVSVGELAAQTGIPHHKNSTAPTSAGVFAELDRYRL
jgi:hypothetical protein